VLESMIGGFLNASFESFTVIGKIGRLLEGEGKELSLMAIIE